MSKWSVLFFCGIFIIVLQGTGQTNFAQFIVLGLDNDSQCTAIIDSIRTKPGISSVRVEATSGNFLALISSGTVYSKEDFRGWMAALGFDLYCFNSGQLGVNPMRKLNRKECDRLEQKQQE